MPQFSYKAIATSGELLEGEIAARDRDDALGKLRDRGVVPIQAEARLSQSAPGASLLRSMFGAAKPGMRDLLLLTRELAVLLRAGIALDRALSKLARPERAGAMRDVAGDLLTKVKVGMPLADAMQHHGEIFPPFYIGIVRAGEAGGSLDAAFDRLAATLEKSEKLRAEIRTALAYPFLVLLLTLVSLVILLTKVIPEFRPLFEDAGDGLPLVTRGVMAASNLTLEWGWLIALLVLLSGILLRLYWRSSAGRRRRDAWLLRLPLVGNAVLKTQVSQFCRTLGTLIENGVALLSAVEIAGQSLANSVLAELMAGLKSRLAKGEGMAASLRAGGVFPDLALQLIEVGEESGSLHQMLLQVADIYDVEAQRAIQRLMGFFVPLVTIALGILIAVVIGAMLSAVLSTYQLPL